MKNKPGRTRALFCSRLCAIGCLLLAGASAHAEEIEPRSFSNTPVGINFLIGAYAYTQGGLAVDASTPLGNL